MLKQVNENFENDVLKNGKPVLVDFFATWCGPCSMVAPILEKIGKEREDFDIAKIDIDQNTEIAEKYDIQLVPTMLLFKNGEIVGQSVGALPENEIIKFVEKHLN